MPEKADAYTRLLGLPPGPRPPDLYTLLGLEPLHGDDQAIAQATRKQMACIKPYEDHPEAAFRAKVQEIMNQIGMARAVLCDPRRKAEYDRRLEQALGRQPPEAAAASTPESARGPQAGPDTKKAGRNLVLTIVEAVSGSSNTVTLAADAESILGRDEDCEVCIEHASVTPRHARFSNRQGHWYVTREDRKAEILVNGQRCTQALLSEGDCLTIGAYEIHVGWA
jgi:curved DNA-binding protein CbpA